MQPLLRVRIADHRGRYLAYNDRDGLIFSAEGDVWALAGVGLSSICLSSPLTGQGLALSGDELTLSMDKPASLGYYADLEKRVALRLAGGAFLCSDRRSGRLVAVRGPLRKDRDLKLFRVTEVAAPAHALLPWPVRCHLRSATEVLYLSHTGGKLAANVEAPCCSEELVLDLGGGAAAGGGAGAAALARTALWSADATELASLEPTTSQLVFQSQHACAGREDFALRLHAGNELTLAAVGPGDESAAAPLVCAWPRVACEPGAKPTRLALELARKPALLVTAHGGLVAASQGRPGLGALCSLGSNAGSLDPATWEFEHHGDGLYSIRTAGAKVALYVGHAGSLRLDGEDPPFPDPRTLFTVELRAVEGGDGVTTFGFAIHSAFKLNGRHLSLTALPDGRVVTCYRPAQPTRWELFAVADRSAATGSAAAPLAALPPQAQEEETQTAAMRRSSSCHNVLTAALPRKPSAAALSSSPNTTLPDIQEHTSDDDSSLEGSVHAGRAYPAFQGGRRCASESALLQLQRGGGSDGGREEPKWLADARRPPQRPSGWGVRSAAPMQDSCCQAVCAAALESGAVGAALPEEVRQRVLTRLAMLTASPEPTKLTGAYLAKASAHGTAPEWAETLVPEELGAAAEDEELPEELAESCVCTACHGSSGFLMPLDPEINPRHHQFLRAMGRRQFGGVRRRRGRGGADPVVAGLQAAKNGLICFGIFKVLAALMR